MATWPVAGCDDDSTYIPTPADDPVLEAAIAEARASLPVFWSKFEAREPDAEFVVKVGFETPGGGVEHIWMNLVGRSGDRVHGRLANEPEYLEGLEAGSEVEANVGDISDWSYEKDGKYYGQYTTRVLLERLRPEHRAVAEATLSPTPLEPQAH